MGITIPEYYSGKHVFLTGGTGFIGKALIEKLLRSCPDLSHIYCLVRPKRGQGVNERFQALLKEPIYDNLREQQPHFTDKITAIPGDLLDEGLGLHDDHRAVLEKRVQIIIHSAATVRFDEPLRIAVQMNVIGVRKMVQLSRSFTNLDVFVHVSTAYSNCDRKHIEERVYPSPVPPQKLIDALEWMNDDMLDDLTPKLIGKKQNSYTYTKQIAETLLVEEGCHCPLAIVRPSVVTAACDEPLAGWVDNWNGLNGLFVAAGTGLLRSFLCDPGHVADIVPVDLPVNMIIAAAWHSNVNTPAENTLVYHITSGNVNPITWGQMEFHGIPYYKRYPLESCFRRPKERICTSSRFVHYWIILFSHFLPAYVIDIGLILMGKKRRMLKLYRKLHKGMNMVGSFGSVWKWTHANMDMLQSKMSAEDRKIFNFDPCAIDWPSYIRRYCMGTKLFILKESPSGFPAARAHLKMLRNVRYVFNTLLLVVCSLLLVPNYHPLTRLFFVLMALLIYLI